MTVDNPSNTTITTDPDGVPSVTQQVDVTNQDSTQTTIQGTNTTISSDNGEQQKEGFSNTTEHTGQEQIDTKDTQDNGEQNINNIKGQITEEQINEHTINNNTTKQGDINMNNNNEQHVNEQGTKFQQQGDFNQDQTTHQNHEEQTEQNGMNNQNNNNMNDNNNLDNNTMNNQNNGEQNLNNNDVQDNTNINQHSETQTQGDIEENKNESEYQRDTLQVVPEGATIIPGENGGQSLIIQQEENEKSAEQNDVNKQDQNSEVTSQLSEQISGTNIQEQDLNSNNITSKDDFNINSRRPMLDKMDITLPFKDDTDAIHERMKSYLNDNDEKKEKIEQLQDFADAVANTANIVWKKNIKKL